MVGWGIIGCGMIAKFHAKAIAEIKGSHLVSCYSRSIEKASDFAKEHGCVAYEELNQMLADPRLNIVTICTPSGAHLEPAVLAAKSGKHVLVEKPLEVTAARCQRLIDQCKKAGVQLGTIFPSRFHRSAQLLKSAVEGGRFGQIATADAIVKWYRTQQYYDSGNWRGTWKLDGGGALMNQAIHSVDLLLWLMGPVKSVSALTALRAHERIEVEDTATAILEFESGALGTIVATTAAYPGSLKRIEIAGSAGSVILEEQALVQWEFAKQLRQDAAIIEQTSSNHHGGGAGDPAAIGYAAHRDLFKDFLKSISTGNPSSIDGAEGIKSVRLIEAIYKSAKSGKRVFLK